MLVLSRGSKACLKLLNDLSHGSLGEARPSRAWLAARLDCPLRTLDRWTAELRKAGLLQVKQHQHHAAVYVVQLCQNGKAGGKAGGRAESPYIGRVEVSTGELRPKPMGTETHSHPTEEEAQAFNDYLATHPAECSGCHGSGIFYGVKQWGKPVACRCQTGRRLDTPSTAIIPRAVNG